MFAVVRRGKNSGVRLLPHLYSDNRYRVSLTKEGPDIPLSDYLDIPEYLANGYSLKMSNRMVNQEPRLIKPSSIHGWNADGRLGR